MANKKSKKTPRQHWADRIGLGKELVKERPFRKLYPFESHHALVGKHNMHYLDEGEGEPVVMLHGNPTWSFFYRDLVLGLRDKFRCLALDHLGCGFSDKPQKYEYMLQNHIDNLERWIEIVLPPADWNNSAFDLVVHDWGGPIGMGYAVRHPERIKRLVILNTSSFVAGTMPARIKLCRTPALGEILVRGFNAFAGLATRMTTKKPLSDQVKKGFLLPYNSWANRVAVYNFVKDIPLRKGMPTYDVLAGISAKLADALKDKPMLIQWGMRDWCFTPFFLKLWKERFPDAEVDEYDAGHYLLEDAGEEIITRVRDFLERPLP
jgi:Predicted hydrolases or acyltransferases (alpha/beta hydrolase superfamily)